MYPISNAVKALFNAEQKQVIRITGTDRNNVSISLTDANIVIDSFNIDRCCCNGQKIEIGTAIAGEMTLKLINGNGEYNSIIFEGTELYVELGVADWSQSSPTISYIPIGYFTPDEQPRKLTTINIKALDRMTRFDTVASASSLSFPTTVSGLIGQVSTLCSVPFTQTLSSLPNYNMSVVGLPEMQQDITYRNIIQWCAGLMGTNAWINWEGKLNFSWYNNTTNYSMTTSNRFSSDLYENAITITGVEFTDTDENKTVYLAGTSNYTLDLTGNPFISSGSASTVLQNIYTAVHDYAYTPFEASVTPAPWLWPMDRVTFTDKNNTGHVSMLTNVHFGLNGNTVLAGHGMTDKMNQSAGTGAFTAQQAQLLQHIQRVNSTNLSDAVNSATALITGADGGYVRFIYDANDKLTEIVIMDTEDITTATKVWRWNSGGLGYSSNGYAGPYTLAMTQNGAIVADFITSGHLSADRIQGGTLTLGGSNNTNGDLDVYDANGNLLASADKDGLFAQKGAIGDFSIENGKLKNGSLSAGGTGVSVGTNGVYYSEYYQDTQNTAKVKLYGQGIEFYWNDVLASKLFQSATGFCYRAYLSDGTYVHPIQTYNIENDQTIYCRWALHSEQLIYAHRDLNVQNNATIFGNLNVYGNFHLTGTITGVNVVTGVKGSEESTYRTGNISITAANVGALPANTTYVSGVKGNSESSYRSGNVNITAANVGALPSNTIYVSGVKGANESSYRSGDVNITAANIGALTSSDIANNLTTTTAGKALDATQGKALKDALDVIGDSTTGTNGTSTVSVPNNTSTSVSSVTISAGTYLLIGTVDWASNATGYRQIAWTDSLNPTRNLATTTVAIDGKEVYQQLTRYMTVNSNTTVTLYARQNSGSSLSAYPYLQAIRLK